MMTAQEANGYRLTSLTAGDRLQVGAQVFKFDGDCGIEGPYIVEQVKERITRNPEDPDSPKYELLEVLTFRTGGEEGYITKADLHRWYTDPSAIKALVSHAYLGKIAHVMSWTADE